MRRYLISLIAAVLMLGTFAIPAMAADNPPEPWCVAGVEVRQFTDDVTRNKIEVTKTTVCESSTVGDITYEYRTVAYWLSDSRGNGHYVAAEDMPTGPAGPWKPAPRGQRGR